MEVCSALDKPYAIHCHYLFILLPSFPHIYLIDKSPLLAPRQLHSHIHDLVWNVSIMHILLTQVPANLATWLFSSIKSSLTLSYKPVLFFPIFFLLQPLSHVFNHSLFLLFTPGLLLWNSQFTYLLSTM